MYKSLSVKSRVRGDFHARFRERVEVKSLRSTRPNSLPAELTFIEVQSGNPLVEEDIERTEWCFVL